MKKKLHPKIQEFIDRASTLTQAKNIVIVSDDSIRAQLIDELIRSHTFIPLKREGSYLVRSDPLDTARVEEKTFICSKKEKEAGPTNHYEAPAKMMKRLEKLFDGSMKGKTAYVIFFAMGSLDSPLCRLGIQITDSPYVVVSTLMMTRVNQEVFEAINQKGEFIGCLHSTGLKGQYPHWPCDPENTVIAHFPQTQAVYSYGSGYGGNALLGKKCIGLRLSSAMSQDKNQMAEHMLIIKVTSPEGVSKGILAAFPSSCGKTNLALIQSQLPGWKVECVGDDIAWIEVRQDGFYAINPEMGFFGVAPGTSIKTNPVAMETISKNTLFTNTALTADQDVWWEQMTDVVPEGLIDWKGNRYEKNGKEPAAHPNSRFTVSILQCPILAPEFFQPQGLKIEAILFGGRRQDTVPLVLESPSYQMGILYGAMLSSEMTSAAQGEIGKLRHDPFAMLPFCGYHMGDYFQHWIDMKKVVQKAALPQFFLVNWFLKDEKGQGIWPGYQENMRVIEWIFRRIENKNQVQHTLMGNVPLVEQFNFEGLKLSDEQKKKLFLVDEQLWKKELKAQRKYLEQFEPRLPDIFYLLIDKLLG